MAANATSIAYYKWTWVWSDDRRVITKSHIKFVQEDECRKDADRCLPNHDTCGGAGSEPEMIISAFDEKDNPIQPEAPAIPVAAETYYKWKWMFGGKEVLTESSIQFTEEDECRRDGERCMPSCDVAGSSPETNIQLVVMPYKPRDEMDKQIRGTFHLGRGMRVQVLILNGRPLIDIRRWTSPNIPSQRGIALSPLCWMTLLGMRHRVNNTIQDIKAGKIVDERMHVSGPIFLSMYSPYWTVNLRRWYKSDESIMATKKGIVLRFPELERLFSLEEALYSCMPELREVVPCLLREDHRLPWGGIIDCEDCHPFGYVY